MMDILHKKLATMRESLSEEILKKPLPPNQNKIEGEDIKLLEYQTLIYLMHDIITDRLENFVDKKFGDNWEFSRESSIEELILHIQTDDPKTLIELSETLTQFKNQLSSFERDFVSIYINYSTAI